MVKGAFIYKITRMGSIPEVALVKTTSKAKSIKVPAKVSISGVSFKVASIAVKAFKGNKTLTKITIGSNVVKIGKNAFRKCAKLKKVIIGKNVKTIGKAVFKGAKKLKTVTVKSGKLTKKSVKNMFAGSKIKTLKLSGKAAKAKKAIYKEYATQKAVVK